ncbi:hypothetical protein ACP70R_018819 [Stipagrostis hirtigluma subsp. patula]
MEIAINAACWVVGRALGPVSDGLLESWVASSELGPNVHALKLELLYAQGMLNNARGRDVSNPALGQLLLELRHQAYRADDVLDELEYFRIQDELEGTYETTDAPGLVGGLVLNTRHTARAVASKLKFPSCSSGAMVDHSDDDDEPETEDEKQGCLSGGYSCGGGKDRAPTNNNDEQQAGGCMPKVFSSAQNTTHAVGKCLPCCSPPSAHDDVHTDMKGNNGRRFISVPWLSKPQHRESVVSAPKLKFDRVGLSKRMVDIIEQLKPLCAKVATILELELSGSNRTMTQGIALDRPKTTPQITEPELYGRNNQKRNVVYDIIHGKYSADSPDNLTVLSIVGPGGIGKTTFTQHIYEEVKSHFHVPIWICVSLNFNANRLIQEIVKQIPKEKEENGTETDEVLIQKRLQSKQFLLVLDDMWKYHEDEWKKLLAPFKKGGMNGSMVIVTTRIPKVAQMVATSINCSIELKRLEYEDCMNLFRACVFYDEQSWESHTGLHTIGAEIVKKLKGSPLAVKTVGRLLRNKLTLDYWDRVFKSKEWEHQNSDDDIMPALKLSYNYLPFHLQQCFSYCALFPEDYEFGSEELIHLWIGLGTLGINDQNNRTEDIGLDYIDDLVMYGFLQKRERKVDHPYYVIHDLLHELAVNVSSHECLSITGSNMRSIDFPTSVRHVSITIDYMDVLYRVTFRKHKRDLNILGKRLKAENLHSLMLFGYCHGGFFKILADLLREAKSLRVILLLGASYNVEDMLHNFSQLIHLRYLRIKDNDFHATRLPNNISRFYNLLALDIKECNYKDYPRGYLREMSNLVKIRHFVVSEDMFHADISGAGKLKSLQELRRFDVQKERKGFELKQLGQLLQLRGSLEIHNLEKINSIKEANEAQLVHMNHLNRLKLHWDTDQLNMNPKQEDVLDCLKPHSNLREVCIRGHGGGTCPAWLVEDHFIKNLECLSLDGVAWKCFPPGGGLWNDNEQDQECVSSISGQIFQNLRRLELINLPRLKRWCGNSILYLLEVLIVRDCSELTELPFSESTCHQVEQVARFPRLRELQISNCRNLLSLPPIPWTNTLCSAIISQVGTSLGWLSYSQRMKYMSIQMGNDAIDSDLWNMLAFHSLTETESFSISECPPMTPVHMQMLKSLKTLSVNNCIKVLFLVEGDNNARYQLPVEDLSIRSCGATGKEITQLVSYFPNLTKLVLSRCEAVTELVVAEKQATATPAQAPSDSDGKTEDVQIEEQQQHGRGEEEIEAAAEGLLLLPGQIQELVIQYCPDLRLCSSSPDDSTTAARRGLQGLGSLRLLYISGCPKFLSSSSSSPSYCPFPSSLQKLSLRNLEGRFTLAPLSNLTYLFIEDCGELRGDLQELSTDDKSGILAVPICSHLFSSITKLTFGWNGEIERFTKEQQEALQSLSSLQVLEIWSCEKLQSLPAGLSGLSKLKRLRIDSCPAMRSFPKDGLPSSLTELRIEDCLSLRSLPEGRLPSSLVTLDVWLSKNEDLKKQCRELKGTIPIVKA